MLIFFRLINHFFTLITIVGGNQMRIIIQHIAWIASFALIIYFYVPTIVKFHKSKRKNNQDFNDLAHDKERIFLYD